MKKLKLCETQHIINAKKGMNYMQKSVKILAVASAITIMSTFSAFASWEQSEAGWKYKDDNCQQYITSQWIESTTEKGLWYYIDQNGVMATDTLIDNQYYVNERGEWRESGAGGAGGGSSSESQSTSSQTDSGFNWDDYFDDVGSPSGFIGSDNFGNIHGAQ